MPAHVARGWYDGCDAAGWGGDLALNRQKNRGTAPEQYDAMTVDAVNALPELPPRRWFRLIEASLHSGKESKVDNGRRYHPRLARWRDRWTAAQRATISRWEGRGVVARGYLIAANRERFEAGNCYRPDLYDEHFWLVQHRNLGKAHGLIAEITPRWRRRLGWTLEKLRRLARQQARVEARGWLLLDQAHPGQVGKTRAGLWEIHPVTGLKVLPRRGKMLLTAETQKSPASKPARNSRFNF